MAQFYIPSNYTVNSTLREFNLDLNLFTYKISIDYNEPIEYFCERRYNVVGKLNF